MKKSVIHFVTYVFVVGIMASTQLLAQWSATALPATAIANCSAASGTYVYAGTFGQGVYRSTNSGSEWTQINTGLTNLTVWSLSIIGDTVFAGTAGGGIFKAPVTGTSWTAANAGIPTTASIKAITEFSSRLYAGTSNGGLHISTDRGAQWTKTNTGLPSLIANAFLIVDTTLYIGLGSSKGLYRSGPNSAWVLSNSGLPSNTVGAFAYIRDGIGTTLFAGTYGGGVVRSTDGGSTWTAVNTGLENNNITTLISVGGALYTGNDFGVYTSTDKGSSWKGLADGFTGASYGSSLSYANNTLYAVYKGGVWKRSLGTTGVEKNYANTQPAGFALHQNFPNPFNPSTTISFSLPEKMNAKLSIYNAIGQVVDVLANREFSAGTHTLNWIANNLSSGIYFYELKTDKFSSVKKLILTK